MLNQYINKFQLQKIKQIKNQTNYIYFFRYDNLNYKEIIILKKELKKINCQFFFSKQKLIKNYFNNLKGQGPLLIIYSSTLLDSIIFLKFKKIKFIYLLYNNNFFSNLKIKKIFEKKGNIPLNYQIQQPIYYFLNVLRKI